MPNTVSIKCAEVIRESDGATLLLVSTHSLDGRVLGLQVIEVEDRA